jgi:uncharacterized protein YndB with AHSA1/START domain
MSTTTITKTVFFNAPRSTVWEFLTNKDKLGEWYHPAKENLVAGEDYCLYRLDDAGEKVPQITGRVIELNAPEKLVTTFVIGPFNNKETTITWELAEAVGGTRLLLKHEGIAEAAGEAAMHLLMALDDGWDKHLANLRKTVSS